ncbi:MAG: acylneuraminate cytidylyltransferase family protein [Candidatus Omnitrophota bacterium]
MTNKLSIVAMVPARRGSTRLKQKNLALLNGKPLIGYAIQAARQAKVFDKIVVNSEDKIFGKIAARYGVEFYQRPAHLATSEAKSDDVVNDFITHYPSDVVVWMNPIAPLQPAQEVREAVDYFLKENLDTLITVKNEPVHCVCEGKPVNFNPDELFARTQDLALVQAFVYSLMMWRTKAFQENYQRRGYAILCGKIGYYPVSKLSAVIIKKEEDLRLAEYLLAGMEARKKFSLQYDEVSHET